MAKLQDFLVSRVRVKLLKAFLSNPQEIYYVRQLVRLTKEAINAVRRELARMEKKKMVYKESRGNRLYYGFRKDYPFYPELIKLIAKTTGIGGAVIANKNKIGKLKFAVLSGKFARRKTHKKTDVDLLVIGDVVLPQLATIVKQFEKKLKREINYTAMTGEEFAFRKRRRDPFITSILLNSRVMLIGDEEDLVSSKEE